MTRHARAVDSSAIAPEAEGDTEIRTLHTVDEVTAARDVFGAVWGSDSDLVPVDAMLAIAHCGGYVSAAYVRHDGAQEMVGVSLAFLAQHQGRPALHSHMTGLLATARGKGLGRAMKVHQLDWARRHSIDWITWTFDPLVRRNAWFNIAVLGAEVHDYLVDFYGDLADEINAGDESDRLLVAWPTTVDENAPPRDGVDGDVEHVLVPTPADIVALRATDPSAARRWRRETREELVGALDRGACIVGFTRDGDYVMARR